ncbi:MAG: hypothetical protein OZ921_13895 [Sorangiineae bacterium]|nr:hypothetical protein [Polyangiaceae bacterium]MEB2323600.1 hypothetical protein [Sorangiineae bacterium]
MRVAATLLAAALVVLGITSRALAAPVTSARLALDAAATLGSGSPITDGWFSIVVRLENLGDERLDGTLEATSALTYVNGSAVVTRAPFSLAGKGLVSLELPVHGFAMSPPTVTVRALDARGRQLVEATLADPKSADPLLFDLSVPSRVLPALKNLDLAVARRTGLRGASGNAQLTVATPQLNPATGDPILPDRAPSYASVTVVLAKSETLARLSGPELTALTGWVMAGGALAIVVTRPEDLRGPLITALVGRPPEETRPADALRRGRDFLVMPDPATAPMPPSGGPPAPVLRRAAPGAAVAEELRGFTGGNLADSPWGASASYGLGEVHLLAFDATREPFVSDGWVQAELADLVRHAWQRTTTIALPLGQLPVDAASQREIRKQLDPNEGSRWAIVVATLLLLGYAVLAGPVTFHLAARRGRPLSALARLPIWAGGAMAAVVVLGVLAKGVRGRARELTLIEAGAGMSRGAATRFRGFYAGNADELTVRGTERESVLDVAGETEGTGRELVVDRDGARLERLRAKPWQTVMVREDGLAELGGGVSLLARPDGQVAVKNRAGRDLVGVLLALPSGGLVSFPRIADGALALSGDGHRVPSGLGAAAATPAPHRLDAARLTEYVEPAARGAGAAWAALEALASSDTDWWPERVPVLVGQLDGGDGRMTDSGLRIDKSRVLVRVVGFGGVE